MKDIISTLIVFACIAYVGVSEFDSCLKNPQLNSEWNIAGIINSTCVSLYKFSVDKDKEIRNMLFN